MKKGGWEEGRAEQAPHKRQARCRLRDQVLRAQRLPNIRLNPELTAPAPVLTAWAYISPNRSNMIHLSFFSCSGSPLSLAVSVPGDQRVPRLGDRGWSFRSPRSPKRLRPQDASAHALFTRPLKDRKDLPLKDRYQHIETLF